jgi:hypothetical protein
MLPHSIFLQYIILISIVTTDLIVSWTAFVDIDIIIIAPTVVIVRLGINDPDVPTPPRPEYRSTDSFFVIYLFTPPFLNSVPSLVHLSPKMDVSKEPTVGLQGATTTHNISNNDPSPLVCVHVCVCV